MAGPALAKFGRRGSKVVFSDSTPAGLGAVFLPVPRSRCGVGSLHARLRGFGQVSAWTNDPHARASGRARARLCADASTPPRTNHALSPTASTLTPVPNASATTAAEPRDNAVPPTRPNPRG